MYITVHHVRERTLVFCAFSSLALLIERQEPCEKAERTGFFTSLVGWLDNRNLVGVLQCF